MQYANIISDTTYSFIRRIYVFLQIGRIRLLVSVSSLIMGAIIHTDRIRILIYEHYLLTKRKGYLSEPISLLLVDKIAWLQCTNFETRETKRGQWLSKDANPEETDIM